MRFYLLLLFLPALLGSCGNDNAESADKLQYFSLSDFMEQEAARLAESSPQVFKTVFLNGKVEEKMDTIKNWKNELSAFTEADINKKSFLGRYTVDSTMNEGNLTVIYRALKKDFRTREMTVAYDEDKNPISISALVSNKNVLYQSHQSLKYSTDQGYWINGSQTIRFLERDSFSVQATFQQNSLHNSEKSK